MTHQLDHSTADASACVGYSDGRDSVTSHRGFITCPRCKVWLRDPINRARADDLERRVTGDNREGA